MTDVNPPFIVLDPLRREGGPRGLLDPPVEVFSIGDDAGFDPHGLAEGDLPLRTLVVPTERVVVCDSGVKPIVAFDIVMAKPDLRSGWDRNCLARW